jgi:hypothetical protein
MIRTDPILNKHLALVGNRRKLDNGSYGDFEWITYEEVWCLANVS